jgi:Laminin G domain
MKTTTVAAGIAYTCFNLAGGTAMAETIDFDALSIGVTPSGWTAGVTGRGAHRWTVEADASAPSKPNVLKQSGQGDFPWCVKTGTSLADGYAEVKFKPVSGKEDQAGGVVWRWKDGDNYYVARANALENNVSLYYTQNGRRITIKYVDAPVARNQWHTLRVEFTGRQIRVALDGKQYIEVEDGHIAGAGSIGVWTKADSVTVFDDFSFGATMAR